MTKDGHILWMTVDRRLGMYVNFGIRVNEQTNEIFVCTESGDKLCEKYDFTSGNFKSQMIVNVRQHGQFVFGPFGEQMMCIKGTICSWFLHWTSW